VTFTKDDLKRVVWTFIQAVLGYAAVVQFTSVGGAPFDWKAFAVGAFAAGAAAVKNLVLADGTWAK
jgi:hypothetical protein